MTATEKNNSKNIYALKQTFESVKNIIIEQYAEIKQPPIQMQRKSEPNLNKIPEEAIRIWNWIKRHWKRDEASS